MNFSALFGVVTIGVCFYLGAFQNSHQLQIFFDQRAFIFVVLGTLAASFLAYPYAVLSKTVDYILWGLLFRKKKQYLKVSQEIATARSSFLMNRSYVTMKESHPFLRECVTFLLNKNIKNEALDRVLHNRLEQFKQKYHEDYHVLKSIAKYPIAFGFISAVCSLIEMMQTGQNSWAYWASALVSVFWGVSFSYFVIWPFADSAYKAAHDDFTLRSLIVDGMMLIRERATDDHFQAYLRGYLSLNDRSEFKINPNPNVYPFATVPKIENHEELDRQIDHSHELQESYAAEHNLQAEPPPPVAFQQWPQPGSAEPVQDAQHEPHHEQPAPLDSEPVVQSAEPAFVTLMAAQDVPAVTGKKPRRLTDREIQEAQRPNLIDQLADKPQLAGHVEGSIRIDLDAHKKLPTFNFKAVRAEMKPEGKVRKG